jgi:hypothetical protein
VGTITFTGGSAAQQQAITAVHARLTAGLPPAVTAAGAGSGDFATWFGNTQSAQTDAVVAAFQGCEGGLTQDFSYDLTTSLPMLLQRRICVLFGNFAESLVSAQLWDGFWSTYYLDQPAGSNELSLGIFHELAVTFNPSVVDILWVDSTAAALSLATVDPAAAAHCPANLAGYLAQFLSA